MKDNNEVSHLTNCNVAPIYDIHWITDNDKFNNALHRNRCELENYTGTCDLFDQYKNQSDFQFGFIPLSDFVLPESEDKNQSITCPLKQHFIVKATGAPNFMKCRILIATQLNIPAWESMLEEYWDRQLIQLLTFGFPLDFNRNCKLLCDKENHTSANDYPDDVDAYLSEELAHNAIIGPFENTPLPDLHYFPFLTR